jgi:hypothetical protein
MKQEKYKQAIHLLGEKYGLPDFAYQENMYEKIFEDRKINYQIFGWPKNAIVVGNLMPL